LNHQQNKNEVLIHLKFYFGGERERERERERESERESG
jgi:hypothetical protein